jgi:DNA invertase Pin-like site-specific DNA recombinase
MPRTVTVIPATVNPLTGMREASITKRRVAGYARVSTDKDEQFTSYEAQVDYYTHFIQSHSDWEFVNVYTDEGISGLGTKKRDGFNKMIADALAGKIDLIVTKSVSRFARNTVDSLVTIRLLKEKGVEVYFEKENIYSLDGKGELLLTIMSSLAQEESRSISENVTWGKRKQFSDGKVSFAYGRFLGYEKGAKKGDPPVVNREQAALVRKIYNLFMQGLSSYAIAKQLTEEGIPTPAGKKVWQKTTIDSILTNEKYSGAARLQKTFTVDYLTKKKKLNEGEVPQYLVENSHEAIIDPDEWEAVQREFKRRKKMGCSYSGKNVLCGKIICADCDGVYGPKVWHSTDAYRTVIWQCNRKFDDNKARCRTPHLKEEDIKKRFLAAYDRLLDDKDQYIAACIAVKDALTDTTGIDAELDRLFNEMDVISELTRKCVTENATSAQDQQAYTARYNEYVARYDKTKARYDILLKQRDARCKKASDIDRFMETISARGQMITEFDGGLWLAVLEKAVVHEDGTIVFCFYNGTEIPG